MITGVNGIVPATPKGGSRPLGQQGFRNSPSSNASLVVAILPSSVPTLLPISAFPSLSSNSDNTKEKAPDGVSGVPNLCAWLFPGLGLPGGHFPGGSSAFSLRYPPDISGWEPGPSGPPLQLPAPSPTAIPRQPYPGGASALVCKRQLLPPQGPSFCPNKLSRGDWKEGAEPDEAPPTAAGSLRTALAGPGSPQGEGGLGPSGSAWPTWPRRGE